MFGILPAWAFYIRHATGVRLDNIDARFGRPDTRPAVVLDDVRDAEFHRVRLGKADGAPTFVLRGVTDFVLHQGRPVAEARIAGPVAHEELQPGDVTVCSQSALYSAQDSCAGVAAGGLSNCHRLI